MSYDITKLPWWSQGAWREPPRYSATRLLGALVEFNPQCKHTRTSYDIMNCNACLAHTAHTIRLRREATTAEDVRDLKRDIAKLVHG